MLPVSKKSVPEDQIFTKIRVALLMVSWDRQPAPTLNHTCDGGAAREEPWSRLPSVSQGAPKELVYHEEQQRAPLP